MITDQSHSNIREELNNEYFSEGLDKLLPALLQATKTFEPFTKSKTAKGSKFSYQYADLDDINKAIKPSLTSNGLVLSHSIASGYLQTRLFHSSGQFMMSEVELPKGVTPQELGAAKTYFTRYNITGLLDLVADEDTDGPQSHQPTQPAPPPRGKPAPHPGPTETQGPPEYDYNEPIPNFDDLAPTEPKVLSNIPPLDLDVNVHVLAGKVLGVGKHAMKTYEDLYLEDKKNRFAYARYCEDQYYKTGLLKAQLKNYVAYCRAKNGGKL